MTKCRCCPLMRRLRGELANKLALLSKLLDDFRDATGLAPEIKGDEKQC